MKMAGRLRIELRPAGLEAVVLPLHQRPMRVARGVLVRHTIGVELRIP